MHVRQMLYRTEHYQIDVQIEAQPDGNRLVIMGQLLDTRRPGTVDVGVHVTLSDGRGNMVHTKTNQFGEFRGEVGNSGDLELSFLPRPRREIYCHFAPRGAGPTVEREKLIGNPSLDFDVLL